jgi:hypothetical protein
MVFLLKYPIHIYTSNKKLHFLFELNIQNAIFSFVLVIIISKGKECKGDLSG